jgi:hypothetical protein
MRGPWFQSFPFISVVALSAPANSAEPTAPCVHVRAEARYRNYGYDHVVRLLNRCERRMSCDVATDVNPTAIRVNIAANEQRDVLTFRGSPAREFAPVVACSPARPM